jgi:hypothetical protein
VPKAGKQDTRLAEQGCARLGDRHAGAVPLEQLNPKSPLQRLYRLRQGGLAQMQDAGRGGKAAFLGHGYERAQFAYLHALIAP